MTGAEQGDGVLPEVFLHPFSSYSWKVLIALYENKTPFRYLVLDPEHPDNGARLNTLSPQGKFPVLADGDTTVFEATIIIEYLQRRYPGPVRLIPADPDAALEVRMLDRFFDNYVMSPMQRIVGDFMCAPGERDPKGVTEAEAMLVRSYQWLEAHLNDRLCLRREF